MNEHVMAFTQSAYSKHKTPRPAIHLFSRHRSRRSLSVCLLGPMAAGKTCFLGGLYLLTDLQRGSKLRPYPHDHETSRFLSETAQALRQGEWPPPTAANTAIQLDLVYQNDTIHLSLLDYPGEDFLDVLGYLNTEQGNHVLWQNFQQADFTLFLLDSTYLLKQDIVPEHSSKYAQMLEAFRNALHQSQHHPRGIAFLLTKCDQLPEHILAGSAEAFLKTRLLGLIEVLKDTRLITRSFFISTVGGTRLRDPQNPNSGYVPQHDPRPSGYEAVFDWLDKQRFMHRLRRTFVWFMLVLLMVLIVPSAYFGERYFANHQARQIMADDSLSLYDRQRLIYQRWQPSDERIYAALSEQREARLAALKIQLAQARQPAALQPVLDEIEQGLTSSPYVDGFQQLQQAAQTHLHDLRVAQVRAAIEQQALEAPRLLNELRQEYADSPELDGLERLLHRQRMAQGKMSLEHLRDKPLKSADSFTTVAEQLTQFLERWPDWPDRLQLEELRRICRLLSQPLSARLTIRYSSSDNLRAVHHLWIQIGSQSPVELEADTSAPRHNWNSSHTIHWSVGDRIQVRLWEPGLLSDTLLGEQVRTDALAILMLTDTLKLSSEDSYSEIGFSLDVLPAETATLIKKYLLP